MGWCVLTIVDLVVELIVVQDIIIIIMEFMVALTSIHILDVAPLMDMGAEVTDVTDAMAVQVPITDILNTITEHLRPLIIILLTMQFIIIVDIFRLFQRENPFLISVK